jgi:hypothetical protein
MKKPFFSLVLFLSMALIWFCVGDIRRPNCRVSDRDATIIPKEFELAEDPIQHTEHSPSRYQ